MPTPFARLGLPILAGGTLPSADFCEAVREDSSALSPSPGHPAALPRSAVIPSGHRRRIDKVHPSCGWRTSWLRAHASRASHTSYPVRGPRPAPSFHASFRPHLTVTPWRFPCPSAPRTPGRGSFTPKHDRMHGTHAPDQRPPSRGAARVPANDTGGRSAGSGGWASMFIPHPDFGQAGDTPASLKAVIQWRYRPEADNQVHQKQTARKRGCVVCPKISLFISRTKLLSI
jgi:hypothetical protein